MWMEMEMWISVVILLWLLTFFVDMKDEVVSERSVKWNETSRVNGAWYHFDHKFDETINA